MEQVLFEAYAGKGRLLLHGHDFAAQPSPVTASRGSSSEGGTRVIHGWSSGIHVKM